MGIKELMEASLGLTEDALEMERQDMSAEDCNSNHVSQEDIDEIVEEISFSM